MQQEIVGFYQDEEGHWIARLACGHGRHVRDDPPWTVRAWVRTEEGRAAWLGTRMECRRCEDDAEKTA